ncbi:hypothetical protein Y032_0035g3122 [Ancylostoma ceylanicum]|uniref:Uncharacterized protein n=1 Tax=Ancylostoma ceylanicum TaxID=53326 RepID=A0A016UNL5_9BILA|nr:hypothetical protein Y032_0035g3122 [Ancylostoma ceylanicum]
MTDCYQKQSSNHRTNFEKFFFSAVRVPVVAAAAPMYYPQWGWGGWGWGPWKKKKAKKSHKRRRTNKI